MAKKLATKKAVIFIVEGQTDKNALEHIFKVIYKNKNVTFEFTRGDISSDETVKKDDVEGIIYKIVEKYMKEKKLKKSDIWQIVQIMDTDGVYIPESAVVEGSDSSLVYSTTEIACKYRQKAIGRNIWKVDMMDYMLTMTMIKGISYRCYFLSSNLDHALYNKLNLTDEEKINFSHSFYELFQGREALFVEFLESEVVNGCPSSYPASWRYIKEDLRSLERHTNLHVYFKENPII